MDDLLVIMGLAVGYNGTTGSADDGYSSGVQDLNVFYDASLAEKKPPPEKAMGAMLTR